MDTFSMRLNVGRSTNRLASIHSRQTAAQTQELASRDMGTHIKEGLGANNGGRNQLGLMVGVDFATNTDPFSKKETETQLQNSSINLAIAQAKLELASEDTDEERGEWLKTMMQQLRELSEELAETLERIAKEREKENNPLAIDLDAELTPQDEARLALQQLEQTHKAETKMAYSDAKEVAKIYTSKTRQILNQIAQLQKEILNDSVQITRVLSGNAPSVDFSVNTSVGGDEGGLMAEGIALSAQAKAEDGSAESPSSGAVTEAPEAVASEIDVAASAPSEVVEEAAQSAEPAPEPEAAPAASSATTQEQAPQNTQNSTNNTNEAPKEPQKTSAAKEAPKTQSAKPIDMKTLNNLSSSRSAKIAKIMKLYQQLEALDKGSSDTASSVAAQADERNRAVTQERKALKNTIYA